MQKRKGIIKCKDTNNSYIHVKAQLRHNFDKKGCYFGDFWMVSRLILVTALRVV